MKSLLIFSFLLGKNPRSCANKQVMVIPFGPAIKWRYFVPNRCLPRINFFAVIPKGVRPEKHIPFIHRRLSSNNIPIPGIALQTSLLSLLIDAFIKKHPHSFLTPMFNAIEHYRIILGDGNHRNHPYRIAILGVHLFPGLSTRFAFLTYEAFNVDEGLIPRGNVAFLVSQEWWNVLNSGLKLIVKPGVSLNLKTCECNLP